MVVPSDDEILAYPEHVQHISDAPVASAAVAQPGGRKKGTAAFIALFFGMFGVHRFYLGQRKKGMWWFILSILSIVITAQGNIEFPPFIIFLILGFLDFILLMAMPRVEFDHKYNGVTGGATTVRKTRRERRNERREARRRQPARETRERHMSRSAVAPQQKKYNNRNSLIAEGLRLYRQEDYIGAIDVFEQAVQENPDLTAGYFNLACAYSLQRNAAKAYLNLTLAIESGFEDFDRIKSHLALSYLRNQPDFQAYVSNGYQVVEQLPQPREDLIENLNKFNPSILDQIEVLGDRLENGELTRNQFEEEKRRILGHED